MVVEGRNGDDEDDDDGDEPTRRRKRAKGKLLLFPNLTGAAAHKATQASTAKGQSVSLGRSSNIVIRGTEPHRAFLFFFACVRACVCVS